MVYKILFVIFCALTALQAKGAAQIEGPTCIVVPAYNEEERIGPMLHDYLNNTPSDCYLLAVLNGCTDRTRDVVESFVPASNGRLAYMDLAQAGKGNAVKVGFLQALESLDPYFDYIGFVDADGSTDTEAFNDLQTSLIQSSYDGVIASRYMPGADSEERPFIKDCGRRFCLLPLVRGLFGLNYCDTQCGAKLFKRPVVEAVAPALESKGWEFDVELLWRAKESGFKLAELPTRWRDKPGSHLSPCCSGIPMLCKICSMKARLRPMQGLRPFDP